MMLILGMENITLSIPSILLIKLSRLGIYVLIEDKTGLEPSSLFGTDFEQSQDNPEAFAEKLIQRTKAACNPDFMIIARIESLILGAGLDDALSRADIYIKAGADGIMIHSRQKTVHEIRSSCEIYKTFDRKPPLAIVPSSFNSVYEQELADMGENLIIYANHLLRSAYPSMMSYANSILSNQQSLESDINMMSINEILNLIPGVG